KVDERTRELKKSQETMVQQEKMVGIGQLAAGIAHELNTPLGTIIGYGQMLREDLAEEPGGANLDDVDEIIGQAGRCRDLVKNLANNAGDSMPNGGDLYVSTKYSEDSDEIQIAVRDTGYGIKESDRNRVFEPFFTTKEVGKGTGLGLSICYKIVENHSGSIDFDTA